MTDIHIPPCLVERTYDDHLKAFLTHFDQLPEYLQIISNGCVGHAGQNARIVDLQRTRYASALEQLRFVISDIQFLRDVLPPNLLQTRFTIDLSKK